MGGWVGSKIVGDQLIVGHGAPAIRTLGVELLGLEGEIFLAKHIFQLI